MNLLAAFFLATLPTASATQEDLSHLRWRVWDRHVPNVILCDDGYADHYDMLHEAVEMWRDRGERLGSVVQRDCGDSLNYGDIHMYTDASRVNPGAAATTVTHVYTDTASLAYVQVWVKPKYVDSVVVLTHELGHALGYRHTSDYYSIMSTTRPLY